MKPHIKVVARLYGIMASNVFAELVDAGSLSASSGDVGRDGQAITAKCVFDNSLLGGLSIDATHGPFKLTVASVAVVLALVPVGNRDGNGARVAERGGLPAGRDAILIGDGFEGHGADDRRNANNSENQKRSAGDDASD